jgi:hypothetical protein
MIGTDSTECRWNGSYWCGGADAVDVMSGMAWELKFPS